jgi:CheY-like chemotaxis protein
MIILVVDDDSDDLDLLVETLCKCNSSINCVRARNGYEALSYLNSCKVMPDMIFMDVNMPQKDGRETLIELRSDRRFAGVKVVMFSTAIRDADKAIFINLNAKWLLKPNTIENYESLIRSTIAA